jgi:murein DD-endopeptidase MepM/ murein hydrolase activator NlpD
MVETLTKQKVRKRPKRTSTTRGNRPIRVRLPGDTRFNADAPRVLSNQSVGAGILARLRLPRLRLPRLDGRTVSGVHRRLDEAASGLTARFAGMDIAVVLAAVGALFALNVILAPSNAFSRVVTRPGELALPGATGRDEVLTSYLDPPTEYDVIGGSADIDTSRFQSVEVQEYELQPGDTLLGLAFRFDLNMDTIVSFNQIEDVRLMRVGEVYEIPNRDGILYTVRQGDALSSIARRYDVDVNAILDANDMTSSAISPGEVLFVPEARMDETELKLILGELFLYPMRGAFTSGFGMRNDPFTGIRRMHYGVDWSARMGTPVRAARAGRVAHIETQLGNYGKFIILRHPGGYQTLYAHLDSFSVSVGQYVTQGQVIGRMGNTGRSTGPHLHFSIIRNGAFVDPMEYLH